jgi:Transposase
MERSTGRRQAVQTIVERPAALDVHKAQVTACARVPGQRGRREQYVAEFATTVRGLLELRDWLAGHGVTQVVMEATGVYWKAPWAVLEDEFDCMLVNARHVKQVPGRKTDVSDAAWLCQLAEAGLLKANFVPPKPIRQLRNLTRYRKTQIQERAREVNRLHKALEDAGIKLDCVAADILGKSGRDMLDALVAGETDPDVLADLARRQMRKKIPALREALAGHVDSHHRLWIGAILRHIDFLDEQIEQLTGMIEEHIRPFAPQARARRDQAHHDLRDLAHAVHRRDLPRARRRLLHQPRPRTPNPTTRQTARTPRTPRNAHGRGRGSLSELFLSDPMGVSSGGCGRLLVDAPRYARRLTGRGLRPRP